MRKQSALKVMGAAVMAILVSASVLVSDVTVIEAARSGNIDEIRALVQKGADVNAAEGDGMTALHWAAEGNHAEAASILLYAGARLDARTRIGAYTPLLVASRVGNAEVIEVLLEAGADVHYRTTTGEMTALHFAAAAGNPRAVELLLDHGAEVDAREGGSDHTPLMVAAANNRLDVVRLLIARGADVSAVNRAVDMAVREEEDNRSRQIRNQRVAMLRDLEQQENGASREEAPAAEAPVEEEAEVAAEEVEEEAPAESPAEEEAAAEEVAEEEEEEAPRSGFARAAADRADDEPMEEAARPLSYAELVGGHGGFNALHLAVRQGAKEVVEELLKAGADINLVSEGDQSSPLLIAAINGHWDLAMYLLEQGADPNIASHAGATPLYGVINLHWAPRAFYPQPRAQLNQDVEYLEIMEALLKAGADPNARLTKHLWYKSFNFDVLNVHMEGATPFWRAAYGTDVRAMRLLLEHGADPTLSTIRPPERRRGGYGGGAVEDQSGLPPVPVGGPSVSPLHAASGAGYGEGFAANAHRHVPGGWVPAARYLIEEVGLDVNARDHQGFTALHHAASRGDVDLIQYLVDQGADVTVISRRGLTVADMANGPVQRTTPYPRAIELLLELGSPFNDNCVSC
jgi:uncharacterized protein